MSWSPWPNPGSFTMSSSLRTNASRARKAKQLSLQRTYKEAADYMKQRERENWFQRKTATLKGLRPVPINPPQPRPDLEEKIETMAMPLSEFDGSGTETWLRPVATLAPDPTPVAPARKRFWDALCLLWRDK